MDSEKIENHTMHNDSMEKELIPKEEELSLTENEIPDNPENDEETDLTEILYISPEEYNGFTYSKASHLKYFSQNSYDEELFGKKIDPKTCDIYDYQNLLVYSYIKNNLAKGSKILEIGIKHSVLSEFLKNDYECWRVNDGEHLTKNLYSEGDIIPVSSIIDPDITGETKICYFDFIFSISAFEKIINDEIHLKYNNILSNLQRLTKVNCYNIHNFFIIIKDSFILLNPFFYFFFKLYECGNRTVNDYLGPDDMKNLPDLYTVERTLVGLSHIFPIVNPNQYINAFSYSILQKNDPKLSQYINTERNFYLKKNPAYFFHHLMKCGGTSLHVILTDWFNLEFDLVELSTDRDNFLKYKYNVENFISDTCVTGHYQYNGIYIHQRYPEILKRNKELKIFTFIRDPLQVRISHYFYLKENGIFDHVRLTDYLKVDNNFLASLFPCDESNYKKVLDEYFFIGIVEKMQESMDKLAGMLNKKKLKVPVVNISKKDSQVSEVTPGIEKRFREKNVLDYKIYKYCLERFNKL